MMRKNLQRFKLMIRFEFPFQTIYNWQNPMGLALQIQNIYIDGTTLNPMQKGIVSVCKLV